MACILVVDDEAGLTTVIKKMLVRLKYTVLTAKTGKEALEKLSLGPVDLLITDIILPDMDGLMLISEIRRIFPSVRIIAMSDGGDGRDAQTGAEQFDDVHCLPKPFTIPELTGIVSRTLSGDRPVQDKQ